MTRLALGLAATVALFGTGCVKRSWFSLKGDPAEVRHAVEYRERRVGDAFDVVAVRHTGLAVSDGYKEGEGEVSDQSAYTEWVLEMPAEGSMPTKVKRAYTIARVQAGGEGQGEPRAYQNRSLLIDRTADGQYAFRFEGGRPLNRPEMKALRNEYEWGNEIVVPGFLPKAPVKIDETWPIDRETIKKFNSSMRSLPYKYEMTDGSGKLTKVYEKDGHQYGSVLVNFSTKLTGNRNVSFGPLECVLTLDFAIDKSVSDCTASLKGSCLMSVRQGFGDGGGKARIKAGLTDEYTVKSVGAP